MCHTRRKSTFTSHLRIMYICCKSVGTHLLTYLQSCKYVTHICHYIYFTFTTLENVSHIYKCICNTFTLHIHHQIYRNIYKASKCAIWSNYTSAYNTSNRKNSNSYLDLTMWTSRHWITTIKSIYPLEVH